jgi:phosphatidylglycerophosphatase A
MNGIVALASQMTETKIILMCVLVVAVAYWIIVGRMRKQFNIQELILVIFDVVAVITGISIFIRSFKMADSEHAVWSGIGGVCIAMMFLDQAILIFKRLLSSHVEVAAEKKDRPEVSA